jgi:phosphoribosylanthranilate isomerase
MTWVKICGITNIEDARWAVECGADAIGFMFAESPRRTTPEAAGEIMAELGSSVTGVGVFVEAPVDEVRRALDVSGCSVAQLGGEEAEEYIDALAPKEVVKTIRVGASLDGRGLSRYKRARAIHLDTYVAGQMGGTGRRFDPAVAARLVQEGWRVIVAGGLTPENVGGVIVQVRPYGVDVSTGVEAAPGRKDREKVAGFIAAVRATDGEGG